MKEKLRLNSNALKVIAIVAMTIDHFTDIFYPGFPASPIPLALHFIGRLTAPIMWLFAGVKCISGRLELYCCSGDPRNVSEKRKSESPDVEDHSMDVLVWIGFFPICK